MWLWFLVKEKTGKTHLHSIPFHQENMYVKCIPLYTPLLCSKYGVCRGIPFFLIFAPKHRLWVLVRTASPIIHKKNISKNTTKFSIFTAEKIPCILQGQVFVMKATLVMSFMYLSKLNLEANVKGCHFYSV